MYCKNEKKSINSVTISVVYTDKFWLRRVLKKKSKVPKLQF